MKYIVLIAIILAALFGLTVAVNFAALAIIVLFWFALIGSAVSAVKALFDRDFEDFFQYGIVFLVLMWVLKIYY